MPDRSSTPPRRPRDANQLAKLVVDIATGEARRDAEEPQPKNPAAVALGRLGGLVGGAKRAQSMPEERRIEIARLAARKRWEKKPSP